MAARTYSAPMMLRSKSMLWATTMVAEFTADTKLCSTGKRSTPFAIANSVEIPWVANAPSEIANPCGLMRWTCESVTFPDLSAQIQASWINRGQLRISVSGALQSRGRPDVSVSKKRYMQNLYANAKCPGNAPRRGVRFHFLPERHCQA